MHANGHILVHHGATLTTALRHPAWITFRLPPTATRRLGVPRPGKVVPCGIGPTVCRRVVVDHPGDGQVCHDDQPDLMHETAAEGMRDVVATVRNAFVTMRHHRGAWGACRRSLCSVRPVTRCIGARRFVRAAEVQVRNRFRRWTRERRASRHHHSPRYVDVRATVQVWLPR